MKEIQQLLEKYYDGDTTLEEEKLVREYLAMHPDAAERADQYLFAAATALKNEESRAYLPKKKKNIIWKPIAIGGTALAAGLALLIGLRGQLTRTDESFNPNSISAQILVKPGVVGNIDNEELALEQARKALAFVSSKLNKGTAGINQLDQLEKSISTIQNKEQL